MATMNRENLEKQAKKAVSNVTHLGDVIPESVKTLARDAADQVSERAGEALETVKETASDYYKGAHKFARQNPVATVAIGFGAGFLLGALIRGGRK